MGNGKVGSTDSKSWMIFKVVTTAISEQRFAATRVQPIKRNRREVG